MTPPNGPTGLSVGRYYLGVALEAGFEDRGIFVRGELAHTFEGWLSVVHGIIRPRVLFDPPEIIYTALDVPASLTFATLQVILPAQFEAAGIRPYGLVGGGGKWYHFGSPTEPNTVGAILPSGGFTADPRTGGRRHLFSLRFHVRPSSPGRHQQVLGEDPARSGLLGRHPLDHTGAEIDDGVLRGTLMNQVEGRPPCGTMEGCT